MSMYDGDGDDMNQIGYKVSNMMLKNTPSSNPKSFKTTAERKAKENEGKTASIITLLDEIDTTIYVINDKLEEAPEIMRGNGFNEMSGGVLTKERLERMKVKDLKDELKKRGIRFRATERKADLIGKLEQFLLSPENVRDFKPKAEQREMETQTEGSYSLPAPPSGMPMSDEEQYDMYRRATEEYEEEPDTPPPIYQDDDEDDDDFEKETVYDDDFEEETLSPPPSYTSNTTAENSSFFGDLDDGSSFNPYQQQRRETPSSRNDLNSNIMRLEEQVNRLSRLTKGLNSFINFSNPVEIEKLDNSYKKVGYSSIELEEHLKEIDFIDKKFEGKINSILNKIDVEYNKIKSALNSYTYTFLEGGMIGGGCCGCEMMGGAFDGAYKGSAKKRFY